MKRARQGAGEAVEVHPGGLDASRGEGLLHDGQHGAALAADLLQRRHQLARVARVLEQHLAVAEHVVERRAELVAEVGQAGRIEGHKHAPPPPNPPPG